MARKSSDDDEAEDLPKPDKALLRRMAWAQNVILFCIIAQIVAMMMNVFALNVSRREDSLIMHAVALTFFIGAAVVASGNIFMLAKRLYGGGVAAVLAISTLLPLVGLVTMLIVNGKAMSFLKKNGVRFQGAFANGPKLS